MTVRPPHRLPFTAQETLSGKKGTPDALDFAKRFTVPNITSTSHFEFTQQDKIRKKSKVLKNLWEFIRPRKVECKLPDFREVFSTKQKMDLGLDVYLPHGERPESGWPSVVLFHGSAFLFGSRDCYHAKIVADHYTENGIAVVAVDYRKIPHTHKFFKFRFWKNWLEGNLQHAVQDATDAIEWTQKHAERYQLDPKKMATIGFSAGSLIAHLAAANLSDKIKAYVSFYGPNDPSHMAGLLGLLTRFGLYGINVSTLEEHKLFPINNPYTGPAFFIHGADDDLTYPEQSLRTAHSRLVKSLETYLHIEKGIGHGFMNDPKHINPATERNLDYSLEFLKMVFARD